MDKKSKIIIKNRYLFLVVIILATFFLGIGYAQISNVDLDITGSVQADKQNGIAISNVAYQSNVGTDQSLSSINMYYQTLLDSHIVLGSDSSSSITYQISVVNLTNEEYVYNGSTFDNSFYDNNNITSKSNK